MLISHEQCGWERSEEPTRSGEFHATGSRLGIVDTHWFRGVFDNILWPIIGFVFLPTTMLWYSAVHNWFGGHWTFWPVVGLVLSLMIDLGPASGRRVPAKR